MASYISKLTRKKSLPDPYLASTYIKFEPVPENWKEVLADYKAWEQNKDEDNEEFIHENLKFLEDSTNILIKDLSTQLKVELGYEVVLSDGSLIYEIIIALPLIELLSSEALNLIEQVYEAYQEDRIDNIELAKSLSRFAAEIIALRSPIKKIGYAINTFAKAYVSSGDKQPRPQVRLGIVGTFNRFETSIIMATRKSQPWSERSKNMEIASKQLSNMLDDSVDTVLKTKFFQYAILKTIDVEKEKITTQNQDYSSEIQEYNQSLNKIHKLLLQA